jgi:hypothetical protein
VEPETEDERHRFDDAAMRRENRLKARETMKVRRG